MAASARQELRRQGVVQDDVLMLLGSALTLMGNAMTLVGATIDVRSLHDPQIMLFSTAMCTLSAVYGSYLLPRSRHGRSRYVRTKLGF
jgi:hypothetical protein